MVRTGAARLDSAPLQQGDVRIVTQDGAMDLALLGDTVSSGLSQSALAKAKNETDTGAVQGSGFGASIEKMVKSTVQGAIGTRIAFPIAEVKGARYEGGTIKFDWVGKAPQLFTNTKVNNRPLLSSFSDGDAQRFVDAVNARKGSVAK